MNKDLQGLRVAIISATDFEQAELVEPRKALEEAGAEVKIVSPEKGQIQGMHHEVKGDMIDVDITVADADPDQFDAVLLPGGALNADSLRMNKDAQIFVQTMDHEKKPIAVICHAPWLLVSSGLVRRRQLTSYYTIQDDIKNAGGIWEDREVVRDRNWVSSRQPSDIPAFNREMIVLFKQYLDMLNSNSEVEFVPTSEFGAKDTHAKPTGTMHK